MVEMSKFISLNSKAFKQGRQCGNTQLHFFLKATVPLMPTLLKGLRI